MSIVSIWNAKGGVGKTTCAVNLASGLTERGYTVLLIDLDDQLSSWKLHQRGDFKWDCEKETPDNKPKHDFIIFDYPPAQTKVPSGSIVIVPFAPSKIDYDSFTDSISLLRGKKFIPLVNKVDFRNRDEKPFVEKMLGDGALMIKLRTIYKKAYGDDKTIFDIRPPSLAKEAKAEINILIDRILKNV